MAINFPNNPSIGQTFTAANTTYEWDGEKWVVSNFTKQITNATFQAYSEQTHTVPSIGTSTYNIDLSLANIFDFTIAADVAFTFVNPPAANLSKPVTIILRQDNVGSRLATFVNAKYTDGILPALSTGASQVDVLTFFTVTSGLFWFGTFAMANVS